MREMNNNGRIISGAVKNEFIKFLNNTLILVLEEMPYRSFEEYKDGVFIP